MRLAIISDVHGNLAALEAVLADIRRHTPDAIVNLGDCVTSPLWPRETLDLLETLDLPTVRGNHDRWIATAPDEKLSPSERYTRDALTPAQRTALGALPATLRIDDGILAVHGTPESDTEYLLEEKVDGRLALVTARALAARLGETAAGLVLCGHSHHQHMAAAAGDRVVVNPGSVGCPRHAGNDDPSIAEAGSPHARYALATRRGSRWRIELHALDYDWSAVARRARDNGRPDWEAVFAEAPRV
jgi:predicted phosphodiesterase